MVTTVNKWGNSLGLRIPKVILEENNICEGSELEISSNDGVITLKPKESYELNTLLEAINESNIHGEILTGNPVGNEIF